MIDPEIGAVRKVRKRPLREFIPSFVVGVRDAVAKKQKRWMGNYAVKVLRTAFAWGRLHGWCDSNPAEGVPLLPRPGDAPVRNRPWSAGEFLIVWERASPRLRRALSLAHHAGLRVGDIVVVPWSAWDGEVLTVRQSKTGHVVHVRAPRPLRDELNNAKREGTQIVVNERTQPYTRDGPQTNLWRLVKKLEDESLVKPGLTFHGLRKGKRAADLGMSENDIAGAMGHSNPASARVYTAEAARSKGAKRVFMAPSRKRKSGALRKIGQLNSRCLIEGQVWFH